MDSDHKCCSTQWKADVCETNSSNSWIWTRSSVYLLISPGALDYLSFQKFAYKFTAIPRINQACICLPAPCPGHSAKSIARRMTSKVKLMNKQVRYMLTVRSIRMYTDVIS